MRDGGAVPVVAGLVSGFLLILIFSIYADSTLNNKPQDSAITWYIAGDEIACGQSIENVKSKAPFPVPLPTVLPTGYSLQYADYSGVKEVFMEYYNMTVCAKDNPKSLREGTIEIRVAPFDERITGKAGNTTNGAQYMDERFQTYERAGNIDAKKYIFSDGNTRHAVGYNAGIGTSTAIDENNVVVHTEQFDYPSSLWVVVDDKGIIYRLEAHMPIDELAKIAESMK